MARGFSAKYNKNTKRLDIKGQYWSRKDAETTFYMLKTFNGLHGYFDCIIDLTECDIDAIRLEKFIEVAIENGLRYLVIVTGGHQTKDWLRDGYPIEKRGRFSQGESHINHCIEMKDRERKKLKRKEIARKQKQERLQSNGT